jgi:hypothetical protein
MPATSARPAPSVRPPANRLLRVFAFDPSFRWRLDTAVINEMVLPIPWEALAPGPVGEYLEVVDCDPASRAFYEPVDLEHPFVLAQDGLAPAEGSPQFHQQMVYAVAMTTIRYFETALGRRVLWADHLDGAPASYVPRLRLYPHALRAANAFYSPGKKALLFGYFPASRTDPGRNLPGGMVFTCLSHDIVAHETTHALLDGLHRRFIESTNPDSLALHEAFADLVALFQHFSFAAALRQQIAEKRGDLADENLLAMLANQFGQAIGRYGALRDALGAVDPATRRWRPREPDPEDLARAVEPHARGAILVAAVFDAFISIYKARIVDLVRIATQGTGVLPCGDLHPDLVERLAGEAATAASHVLNMCIRALDYCPTVDIDFGDYLRALITADRELVPDDVRRYRIAVIEAFRRRGIYPEGVRSLSEESVAWDAPRALEKEWFHHLPEAQALRDLQPDWSLRCDRQAAWKDMRRCARLMHDWIRDVYAKHPRSTFDRALGLALDPDPEATPLSVARDAQGRPLFEVHSLRPARRIGPDGNVQTDLVVEITQRRLGYADPELQEEVDRGKKKDCPPDFIFRGGCTVLVSPEELEVRYCIGKGIKNERRFERQRRFLTGESDGSLQATYFRNPEAAMREPFALLHRQGPDEKETP